MNVSPGSLFRVRLNETQTMNKEREIKAPTLSATRILTADSSLNLLDKEKNWTHTTTMATHPNKASRTKNLCSFAFHPILTQSCRNKSPFDYQSPVLFFFCFMLVSMSLHHQCPTTESSPHHPLLQHHHHHQSKPRGSPPISNSPSPNKKQCQPTLPSHAEPAAPPPSKAPPQIPITTTIQTLPLPQAPTL